MPNYISYKDFPDFFDKGRPKCSEVDPDIFFPEPDQPNAGATIREAKRVCETCPYLEECREWAISHGEMGIWGGTTETERRRLLRQRAARRETYSYTLPISVRK